MAIIGPRPALWNQYDLIEERDKYHANDADSLFLSSSIEKKAGGIRIQVR